MRSIRLLAVAVLALVLALSSTQNVFAAVVDQKQETHDFHIGIIGAAPLGQEFTPGLPVLEAVEVWLSSIQGNPDDTITLTVRQGTITGTVLATATNSLASGFEGWVYFALGSVSVTPGATYVIRLSATQTLSYWGFSLGANPYPGGRAIQSGVTKDDSDQTFRTYGPSGNLPPVGGVVMPANTLAILGPWFAVIGLVGCIGTVVVVAKKRQSK